MKRSPGYHVFSTYIPSVLIVIMSWIRLRRTSLVVDRDKPRIPWLYKITHKIKSSLIDNFFSVSGYPRRALQPGEKVEVLCINCYNPPERSEGGFKRKRPKS